MDVDLLTPPISKTKLGLILQRGGEELGLSKVKDRFTVCFANANAHLPTSIMTLAHHQLSFKDAQSQALWVEEVTVPREDLETAMLEGRKAEGVLFVSHVYKVKDHPETFVYLSNQITIQFAPDVSDVIREQIESYFHLQLIKPVQGLDYAFVYQLSQETTENPLKITNRLQYCDFVITAEANVMLRRESFYHPQETFYDQQWYLHHNGGKELAFNSHIEVESAWDLTKGDRRVIVAIADEEIDLQHPDFQGQGKIVHPKDFTDGDFQPLSKSDQASHGTVCASLALAEENGQGLMGVAPQCALMPLKINGLFDDQSIEDLFNYALEKGASVMVCSWGVAAIKFPLSLRQNMALHRLATEGRQGKGCVVVLAVGNANRPLNGTIYERGWHHNLLKGRTQWLNGFASHPDVIAVSACTSLNKKAAYSNWGEEISVCAPSNNSKPMIWFEKTGAIPTAPEVTAPLAGQSLLTTNDLDKLGYDLGNFISDIGGTSSACAIVAGVAGLILSINPDLTAKEVKEIVQVTADKIIDLDPDPQLGMKMGTYNHHGHSPWFGYGKINAHKAVQLAKKRINQEVITQVITQENYTEIPIPDDEPTGIFSVIKFPDQGTIKELKIRVKIEHEFLGDLEISLRSPNDQIVLLQNRTLGTKTNLDHEYNLANTPSLQQLIKQSVQGDWLLWIVDYAKEDTGMLKGWELEFKI